MSSRQSIDRSEEGIAEWYPHYVNPDEVEFDYAFYRCRCGWESERCSHPSLTEAKADGHRQYYDSPDCGLGKHIIVFKDGSTADI
jgi:hypothetical protein